MNFSKSYQDMCLKTHDIQTVWIPEKGDIYISPNEDGALHFWMDETSSYFFRQGFAILRKGKLVTLQQRIWIPRHNQLMELAQVPGIPFREMTYRFHEWTKIRRVKPEKMQDRMNDRNPSSIEEAWIAFVMETRFGKHWDGENWISIEEKKLP